MTTVFLYLTLCTAAYYLLARAKLTEPLWRRYPSWLAYWTDCAACSGLWYGAGCGLVGRYCLEIPLLGLPHDSWVMVAVAGVMGMVWTPVTSYAMVASWSLLMDNSDGESSEDNSGD